MCSNFVFLCPTIEKASGGVGGVMVDTCRSIRLARALGEYDGCMGMLPGIDKWLRLDGTCKKIASIGSANGELHAAQAVDWFDCQVKVLMLAANGTSA